jgi:hypothetical protein
MNDIVGKQDEEGSLTLLRARSRNYAVATRLLTLQIGLGVVLPVVGGVLAFLRPELRPFTAAAALAAVFLDVLFIDRGLRTRVKRAARISEQFDCEVLDLPWDRLAVGDKVETEDVNAAARAHSPRHDGKLRGWYPQAVARMPMHVARIVCQRTNLRYDGQLRITYGAGILTVCVALGLMLGAVGLAHNLPLKDFVLHVTTVAPIFVWGAREFYRQKDAAAHLEGLIKEANKFRDEALDGGLNADACSDRSRRLQNAIHAYRAGSPLIAPFIYRFKRPNLEDDMEAAAREVGRRLEAQAANRVCSPERP